MGLDVDRYLYRTWQLDASNFLSNRCPQWPKLTLFCPSYKQSFFLQDSGATAVGFLRTPKATNFQRTNRMGRSITLFVKTSVMLFTTRKTTEITKTRAGAYCFSTSGTQNVQTTKYNYATERTTNLRSDRRINQPKKFWRIQKYEKLGNP